MYSAVHISNIKRLFGIKKSIHSVILKIYSHPPD